MKTQAHQPVQSLAPASLADLIDRVLDKGLVINADIVISVAGIELLGIMIRAAVASLETAAKYGLQLPAGTNIYTDAWKDAQVRKESCPGCGKRSPEAELLSEGCPWCGWAPSRTVQEKALAASAAPPMRSAEAIPKGPVA